MYACSTWPEAGAICQAVLLWLSCRAVHKHGDRSIACSVVGSLLAHAAHPRTPKHAHSHACAPLVQREVLGVRLLGSMSCTGHVHPLCRALDTCSAHSLCRALDTCTPSLCALLLSDICCHVCCHVTVCCAARCCKRVRTWPHLCSLLRPLPRASCHHVHTQGRQTFGAGARAVSLSTHYTSKWRNFLDSRCVFATGSQHLWCRGSQSKHSLCGSVL